MNENEINNYPSEDNPEPIEEMDEQVSVLTILATKRPLS